ncbi:unnamed protein product [Rodentolepis nana]|uniref:cardiolipin synthase (CMP-forming) n=1 Tax=Rodentolepis nana TaxID=102285 RepID=A0A0R3TP14_RODNA|nr:unnamed protein product [Rodentolepis nana]
MYAYAIMNVRNFSRLSPCACKLDFILRPGKYTHGFTRAVNDRWSSSQPQNKIITIPNILTSLRIASTPVIVSLILQNDLTSAAVLTVAAGLTDVADGYIARSFPNQQSIVGSYLDPLADKLFVSLLAVSLAYTDLFPTSLLFLFLSRDALILIGASLVIPKEKVIEMKPINSSKLNTAVQISTVVSSLLVPVFGLQNSVILPVLWLSAGLTTLYSGFGYARIFPSVLKEAQQVSISKSKK